MKQVLAHLKTLDSLCKVLGLDFKHTVAEIHPSMDDSIGLKNLSSDTIDKLAATILSLREVKTQRMHKVSICVNVVSILCFVVKGFGFFFFCLAIMTLEVMPASRSCSFHVGALEFNGYTNQGATDVPECYQ